MFLLFLLLFIYFYLRYSSSFACQLGKTHLAISEESLFYSEQQNVDRVKCIDHAVTTYKEEKSCSYL